MNQRQKQKQIDLVANWEFALHIPSMEHARKQLGISWLTYQRYRNGSHPIPIAIRYAMQAIAYGLQPWGEVPSGGF